MWNQQLRGGFVSADLKGVAGRDLWVLVEVLLINELGGSLKLEIEAWMERFLKTFV